MSAEGNIDEIILRNFSFHDSWIDKFFQRKKVLLEVGAASPDYLSIGAAFRGQGWRVISVEPNPVFCSQHRALGLEIYQYAAGNADRDDVDFTIIDSHGAAYEGGQVTGESFSSLGITGDFRSLYETVREKVSESHIRVKLRKLDTILREHASEVEKIDVLAVDVEGWELEVIEGFSLEKYKPKVVVLENLFKSSSYEQTMQAQSYQLWRRIEPNDIYLKDAG